MVTRFVVPSHFSFGSRLPMLLGNFDWQLSSMGTLMISIEVRALEYSSSYVLSVLIYNSPFGHGSLAVVSVKVHAKALS